MIKVGYIYKLVNSCESELLSCQVSQRNRSETDEIKQNAARYMREITSVLAYVNRQMILIFKTNDLLRSLLC